MTDQLMLVRQAQRLRKAKAYLRRRGLTPMPIGRCYTPPPPVMGRDAEQLQRVLLTR